MSACPSCNTNNAAGARWCFICHTNVVNPEIGRLSSPWKRLGAYVLDYLLLLLIVVVYLVPDAVGEYMDVGAISTVSVVLLVVYAGLSLYLFAKGMTIGKKLLGMRVVKEDGRQAGGPGQPLAGIPAKRTDDARTLQFRSAERDHHPVDGPPRLHRRRHPGRRLHPASHFKNRDRIRRADSAQLCDRAPGGRTR